jgi:GTP-binding protein HflX
MFERPKSGEKAILVHMDVGDEAFREDLNEFKELAVSAGAEIVTTVTCSRNRPESRYFVGSGKAEEIKELVSQHGAELVLFNHALTPSQERNIEKLVETRVLDRTGLILDIFAQRARSFEGKLQVELAQLKHMMTRLIRGWTHLERQKGGIGLRGPGETQLETDRRLLGMRVKQINKRLEKVRKQREQGRQSRRKAEIPTVSLVGYTNAGKSTLFNRLADENVYVQDQLFATLDPTLRKVEIANDIKVVLADTVGFIRHLPHDLVNAFQSTLQETSEAQLLLHVVDASDENRAKNIEEVESVLKQIGANDVYLIQVMNKIDLCGAEPRLDYHDDGKVKRVWLSAMSGEGLELLEQALAEYFREEMVSTEIRLFPAQARIRALLFELGVVQNEVVDNQGCFHLDVCIAKRDLNQLIQREHLAINDLLG